MKYDSFVLLTKVDVRKQVICHKCRGSGADKDSDVQQCSECQGHGVRIIRQQIAPGMYQQMQMQ
jgi:DnaJ-related protein SCJ1